MPRLIYWFRQPAQLLSNKEKLWMYLLIGLFLFLFFLFFQPFGVNNYDPREMITLEFALYMVLFSSFITFVLLLNEWLLSRPLSNYLIYRWQLLLWLLWTLIFSSSLIFLFYNWLGEWHDFHLSSWLEFISNFAVLGLLPLAVIMMYAHMKHLKDLTATRKDYRGDAHQLITFPADNQKDVFSLTLESLLYLESEDNYVAVHYLKSSERQKALVRLTLKRIEALALHPALIRCHRSTMINLFHLQQYTGNQQQGQLSLHAVDQPFPVSKSYAAAVMTQLQ